jgi:hypothetical protein
MDELDRARVVEEGAVRVRVGDSGRAGFEVEATGGDAGAAERESVIDGGETLSGGESEGEVEWRGREVEVLRPFGAEFPREPSGGFEGASGTSMRLRGRCGILMEGKMDESVIMR